MKGKVKHHTFATLHLSVALKPLWADASHGFDGSCLLNGALSVWCTGSGLLTRVGALPMHAHQTCTTVLVRHACNDRRAAGHGGPSRVSLGAGASKVVSKGDAQGSLTTWVSLARVLALLVDAGTLRGALVTAAAPYGTALQRRVAVLPRWTRALDLMLFYGACC